MQGDAWEAPSARSSDHARASLSTLRKWVTAVWSTAVKMPAEVAPYFIRENLFAPNKKLGGGLRHVAVGGVLRWLTSKWLAYKVEGRMTEYLRPLQFGVRVWGGCEVVVHTARAILADDFLPMECCYGSPPLLNFGDMVLLSAARVQQGTPLVLFSLLSCGSQSWEICRVCQG